MTEAEAKAEAARLAAKKEKGVKYTAQHLCRGWAVERRAATVYFAFDGYIHEVENGPSGRDRKSEKDRDGSAE